MEVCLLSGARAGQTNPDGVVWYRGAMSLRPARVQAGRRGMVEPAGGASYEIWQGRITGSWRTPRAATMVRLALLAGVSATGRRRRLGCGRSARIRHTRARQAQERK